MIIFFKAKPIFPDQRMFDSSVMCALKSVSSHADEAKKTERYLFIKMLGLHSEFHPCHITRVFNDTE